MPEMPKDFMTGEKISRAFFAALLSANRVQCECETCKILKSVSEDMTKEFVPK